MSVPDDVSDAEAALVGPLGPQRWLRRSRS